MALLALAAGAWAASSTPAVAQRPPVPGDADPARSRSPAGEPSEGRHCAGRPDARWVGDQLLAVQLNPLGVETTYRMGACFPLVRAPGVLFDQTHLQVGVLDILSPAYDHFGAYVQLAPLSLLVLRAELAGVATWVFPTRRAAYFGLDSYDADYDDALLQSDRGGSALGWNLTLTAILRLKVRLGPLALVALDAFSYERWSLGDAPYFVVLRHDVIAARHDGLVANEGLLLAEIPLSDALALRAGAFDSLRWVPESGSVRNLVGGLVSLVFTRPSAALVEVQPLVRVGVYTHHAFREGELSLVVGATAAYDFGRL